MVIGLAFQRLKNVPLLIETKESPISVKTSTNNLGGYDIEISVVIDNDQAQLAIDHLLSRKELLGLDIETKPAAGFIGCAEAGLTPRKSEIRLVQIYDGGNRVFVFDVQKLGKVDYLFGSLWKKPMVAHNALFELKHLLHMGIVPKKLGCTLLADRTLNGNRRRLRPELNLSISAGLKDLAEEFLGIDISKEEQTSDWSIPELTQEQIEYAALDAVLPVKIFEKQRALLKGKSLCKAYETLRNAQTAVAMMELNGIGFDVEEHKKRIGEWKSSCEHLKQEIILAIGQRLNLNSSKQVGEWLKIALNQDDLGSWAKTPKGALSTSTGTFKLNEHIHDIFPQIVEYRHIAKRISSFGESLYKFIDIPSRRLYGSFSLGTTSTGRMASQKPNLQNMPRTEFRDLFYAKDGHAFIDLDYSQQEIRVAALLTEDKELLRIYSQGGDVHTNTAASILKISNESVTKDHRQLAKAVIFGLLYGQGAKGLARYAKQQYGVDMTEEEAEKHRAALFRTYKGLRAWQKTTGNRVKITGIIRTSSGRIRDFRKEQEGYSFTAALNHPIQGAAAEITLQAMSRLTSLFCEECRLVNVIHDEILLEVIETRTEEFAEKAKEAMEAAFIDIFPHSQPYLKGLVEAKIGKNWSETK